MPRTPTSVLARSEAPTQITRCRKATPFLSVMIEQAILEKAQNLACRCTYWKGRVTFTAQRPVLGADDVFLFGFVQLAAIGNVRGDQVALFLRRQRRGGIVRLIEQIDHGLIPEQARIGLAHDLIEAP